MVLEDTRIHSEHSQVIKRDIKPRSAEKSRDAENGSISEKKRREHT
jgi:hypothetical protein